MKDFVCCEELQGETHVLLGGSPSPNAIIVSKPIDRGQYQKFKRSFDYVIYRPDFSNSQLTSDMVEKQLRHFVEHGFCDGVAGMEFAPWFDGLHKKKIFVNHVIAKLMRQHNLFLLLDFNAHVHCGRLNEHYVRSRQRELYRTVAKFGVVAVGVSFAQSVAESVSLQSLQDWLVTLL